MSKKSNWFNHPDEFVSHFSIFLVAAVKTQFILFRFEPSTKNSRDSNRVEFEKRIAPKTTKKF